MVIINTVLYGDGDIVKNISYGDTVSFEKKRHVDSGFSHVCSKKGFLKFDSFSLNLLLWNHQFKWGV